MRLGEAAVSSLFLFAGVHDTARHCCCTHTTTLSERPSPLITLRIHPMHAWLPLGAPHCSLRQCACVVCVRAGCAGAVVSSPVLFLPNASLPSTGLIIVGALDAIIYCAFQSNGSTVWALQTSGSILSSPLLTYLAAPPWDGSPQDARDAVVIMVGAPQHRSPC